MNEQAIEQFLNTKYSADSNMIIQIMNDMKYCIYGGYFQLVKMMSDNFGIDISEIKTCIGNDKDKWYCVIDKELFEHVVFS